MNIIIPIGGIGQRFIDEGFLLPKPLINVLGKPMIFRVIENLKLDDSDVIHIVYNNYLKEYNFEDVILFRFPNKNINFISLENQTKGTSETVLECLNNLDENQLNNNFLLLDCDTFYDDNIIKMYKESENKNLIFYFLDKNPNPLFSYIRTDSYGKLIEIKEKIKISDKSNTGAYGFENGVLLKKYCNKINHIKSELYISYVYNEMLNDNIDIHTKEISNINCVGTPLQLKIYCNNKKYNSEKLRICFDLDNTLVTYPKIIKDYGSVDPIIKNINYLKLLKNLGHTIIIYTARRMMTHKGNLGAVTADIAKITIDTLEKFEIPYDELYFGKPHADFYIDDLSVNPNLSMDELLGIFNTETIHREFNKVYINEDKVFKKTPNKGEIFWYKNIPKNIDHFFPKTLHISDDEIILENIQGVNYSYLYINKILTIDDLDYLLDSLNIIHQIRFVLDYNIYSNYSKKITKRFLENKDLYSSFENSHKIYDVLIKKLDEYEKNNLGFSCVIHGDPVFTNVLKTNDNIKFIDMRGKLGDDLSLIGDVYYDLSKVYQSILGYDFILNDINIDYIYVNKFVSHFEKKFSDFDMKKIKLITASFFFSLLPLHVYSKDRFQKYFNIINNLL